MIKRLKGGNAMKSEGCSRKTMNAIEGERLPAKIGLRLSGTMTEIFQKKLRLGRPNLRRAEMRYSTKDFSTRRADWLLGSATKTTTTISTSHYSLTGHQPQFTKTLIGRQAKAIWQPSFLMMGKLTRWKKSCVKSPNAVSKVRHQRMPSHSALSLLSSKKEQFKRIQRLERHWAC